MTGVLKRVLDPLLRLWSPFFLLRAGIASSVFPQPTDAPRVQISGPDPDRILVAGGGIAVGFGVLSHALGIAGHLARKVSGATGRGVDVDIIASPDLTIDDVPRSLADSNLDSYDAVVLMLGVTDSMRRTSARAWRQGVAELIHAISDRTAAGTHIFVVGVQPVRLVTTLDNRVGLFAELYARALDRETIRACSGSPQSTYIPFRPQPEPTERYRTSDTYGKWAGLLSPAVVDVLQRNHPLRDFCI